MKKIGYALVILLTSGLISFFVLDEPRIAVASDAGVGTTIVTTTEEVTNVETTKAKVKQKVAQTTTTRENIETKTKKTVEATTKKKVEATTTIKKAETKKEYTDNDVYLLAQILYCEAGGCTKDEMAKVGQVVLNRKNTDYWEFASCDTIYEVLCHENSYPQTLAKIRNGIRPSDAAMQVAKGLLNGSVKSGLSEDVLWQTGFKPSWNVTVVLVTEWHYYSVLAA